MLNLQALTKEQVAKIALEKGITLSYKGENGKRQRYTKLQLIEMIVAAHEIEVTTQTIPTELPLVETIVNTVEVVNEQAESVVTEKINLNTVVSESRKLLASGNIDKVKNWINKLLADIAAERKNKLLVNNMSAKVNILKSLIKSYSKGKVSYV